MMIPLSSFRNILFLSPITMIPFPFVPRYQKKRHLVCVVDVILVVFIS